VFGPAVGDALPVAHGGPGQSKPIRRIKLRCSIEKFQRREGPLLSDWEVDGERPQIKILSS
jgi:hypothetical protein